MTHPGDINALLGPLLFDGDNAMIGALWSLATEVQFYALIPLLFALLSSVRARLATYLLLAAAVFAGIALAKLLILRFLPYPWAWHELVFYPVLMNLDCFVMGMLTAFAVRHLKFRGVSFKHGLPFGYAAMAAFYFAIAMWSYHEMSVFPGVPGSATRGYYLALAPGVTAMAAAIIIACFELSERRAPKFSWGWRVQTFFGLLTYCLYVWHEPVLLALRKVAPMKLNLTISAILLPVGLTFTLLVAMIFYFGVESRFDKKRSYSNGMDAPPSPNGIKVPK